MLFVNEKWHLRNNNELALQGPLRIAVPLFSSLLFSAPFGRKPPQKKNRTLGSEQ